MASKSEFQKVHLTFRIASETFSKFGRPPAYKHKAVYLKKKKNSNT